ncbi:hypothetical protein F2Q68_00003193 [Brassica cretica]|uniref:Uncharacterized protein n=1 Tax=Brassica cretica TaxID=69181 RepID=A0A8S9JJX4_BRACR|nr:hypothetical protein F2Q68_00003193 [Brassica cretica]
MNVRGNIPTKFALGIFRGHFRQTSGPRNFLGSLFPRNSVGKFRGISEERRNSEELFPTTCFVVEGVTYTRGDLMLLDSYLWALNNPGESNLMLLSKDIKQDTWGMRLLTFLHRNDCYILLGEPLSEFTVPSDAEWIWKSLSD